DVVRDIVIAATESGVEVLTLYAFSTENWQRPKSEVDFLMRLPKEFLHIYLPEMIENHVKIDTIGEYKGLPDHTHEAIDTAKEQIHIKKPEMIKKHEKIDTIREYKGIPDHTREAINHAKEETKENTGLVLNFALNYGSRNEIIEAVKLISNEVNEGNLNIEN